MVRERDDGALELEVAPRKLGLILGGALLVFGLLGALAATRGQLTSGTGYGPVVFSVLLAALGGLTLAQARGLRAVLDRKRKLVIGQTLGLGGASKPREVAFGDVKELALLGSSSMVGLYLHWGEFDDMIIGRFVPSDEQRSELKLWVTALRKALPAAKFESRPELEAGWLK
jgi:hypothetical protein